MNKHNFEKDVKPREDLLRELNLRIDEFGPDQDVVVDHDSFTKYQRALEWFHINKFANARKFECVDTNSFRYNDRVIRSDS